MGSAFSRLYMGSHHRHLSRAFTEAILSSACPLMGKGDLAVSHLQECCAPLEKDGEGCMGNRRRGNTGLFNVLAHAMFSQLTGLLQWCKLVAFIDADVHHLLCRMLASCTGWTASSTCELRVAQRVVTFVLVVGTELIDYCLDMHDHGLQTGG